LFTQPSTTLTGRIVDWKGQILPGVAVQIAGNTRGIMTDEEGFFTMNEVKTCTKLKIT
jgi:hypothetical protein